MSDATLAKWRDAFLSGGAAALANGSRRGQSSRETDLETELKEVKAARGEAHAELRVWQSDFSEFETTGGGIWRLSGVVDYVAKVALACTSTGRDMARPAAPP